MHPNLGFKVRTTTCSGCNAEIAIPLTAIGAEGDHYIECTLCIIIVTGRFTRILGPSNRYYEQR
jgi:hypothetical protein